MDVSAIGRPFRRPSFVVAMALILGVVPVTPSAPALADTAVPEARQVLSKTVSSGAKVRGNQIRIRVRGARLGKRAEVTLSGYRGPARRVVRKVSVKGVKTVRKLKPGWYRISAKRIRRNGSTTKATKIMPRQIRVTRRRGATIAIRYQHRWNGRNAIAYAPLSDPAKVTVLGRVASSRAWSTSKVLVVLAFIKTASNGNPANLSRYWGRQIKAALAASDMGALRRIRGAIPGGSGRPMTKILRRLGDERTTAPNIGEGSMQWSIRNQVRFMAALHDGRVVSRSASRFVLRRMSPIPAHRWGLGTIGASSFKGGWLRADTETRQMGIVGQYAVAIITKGVGPAKYQTDGDWAHVRQMNRLAKILKNHV